MKKGLVTSFLCVVLLQLAALVPAVAQTVQGVVLQRGTSTRLVGALVINLNSKDKVSSNNSGGFTIPASLGDTLEIRCIGFLSHKQVVHTYASLIVNLRQSNVLSEVVVHGNTLKKDLKEVEDQFRSKGIYYKGKPPLALLIPFGGSPLTFFHELLSKDGKRARRFHKYAERELEYYEIASRFNNGTIKRSVPIKDDELLDFKDAYMPTAEQLRSWNDFDLVNYIKRSYEEFKKTPTSSQE
ncbi:carboxypeptidase-like regulatory domain-containing protein [Desertivirga xinjiangensis]|uniref:carboxypeptidase-like regulatory domain-containing protein n=1 Tax=Desertivirga xinjiangensis TaxID=539206 RepID=UPI00210AD509|nr:carboxypeptidase-like regulatory domain-containing protein [Pedobacter xinjiangensis]